MTTKEQESLEKKMKKLQNKFSKEGDEEESREETEEISDDSEEDHETEEQESPEEKNGENSVAENKDGESEDSGSIEEVVVAHTGSMSIPYVKCHVCRHFMPSLPKTLPEKYGGDGKKSFGKEFNCYTEKICPAQTFSIIHNPVSTDMIEEAVLGYVDTGDFQAVSRLYRKVEENSILFSSVHEKICAAIKGVVED